MTVDGRLFAYLRTRLAGDSTIAAANAAIVRDDWVASQVNQGPPRIEYNPFRYRDDTVHKGEFGLTIVCERPNAFGTESGDTAGTLETLEGAVIARLANVRPNGVTGFAVSTIDFNGVRRTTLDDPTLVTLRLDFTLTAIPGGSVVPLSGDDADLTSAGIDGRVTGWQVDVDGPSDTDHTELTDTVQRVTLGDPIATGYMDIVLTASATPMPTRGQSISVTFSTESTVSWTDTLLVTKYQWIKQGEQMIRLYFAVTNEDSPFYA